MAEQFRFQVVPIHPGLVTSDYGVHESGVTVEPSISFQTSTRSCFCSTVALLQSFRHFPYNVNPTNALNTTSLKCCLPSTDAIDRREKNSRMYMNVQGCLMQVHFFEIHHVFAKRNKVGYFSSIVAYCPAEVTQHFVLSQMSHYCTCSH